MREWLLRAFFPGVVIRRLEREAAEKRIADLEAEVAEMKARPTPQPLIINNPPPYFGIGQPWQWQDVSSGAGAGDIIYTTNFSVQPNQFKLLDDDEGAAVAQ